MPHTEIKKYLDGLDQKEKVFEHHLGECEITQEIGSILKKDKTYQPTKEDIAEHIAFYFMPDYPDNDSGWHTYYGPMSILPDDKGEMIENPSIKEVDKEILEYWEKRSRECKNPVLSSRYADLVIDFSPKVLIDLVHIVIDSNIKICNELLTGPLDYKTKIKRALDLAIQTNDKKRIQETKKAIIQLEDNIAEDNRPGLWGFAFRWLILDYSKKVDITNKECNKLINDIEERLTRIEKNCHLTEHAVDLLAKYYASEEEEEKNLMRVLGVLENTLKKDERLNSDAILKWHAYENIRKVYAEYASQFDEAEKASKRLSQEIGKLDLDCNKSLKQIFIEKRIEEKYIESDLKMIFGENMNDELDVVMDNFSFFRLPMKEEIKKQFDDELKQFSINNISSKVIISEDGMIKAKIPPLNEDDEKHFFDYYLQYIQIDFLSPAIDELKKQFSKDEVLRYFENSFVFKNKDREYLKIAIYSYWDEDYLISSHLFIPLIESLIRELIRHLDGGILKPNNQNGDDYVSLNVLLEKNEEVFKNIHKGDDISFYFKLVLTEKIGMNLRNDCAHGIDRKKFFRHDVSDRLFHILILLSVLFIKGR